MLIHWYKTCMCMCIGVCVLSSANITFDFPFSKAEVIKVLTRCAKCDTHSFTFPSLLMVSNVFSMSSQHQPRWQTIKQSSPQMHTPYSNAFNYCSRYIQIYQFQLLWWNLVTYLFVFTCFDFSILKKNARMDLENQMIASVYENSTSTHKIRF